VADNNSVAIVTISGVGNYAIVSSQNTSTFRHSKVYAVVSLYAKERLHMKYKVVGAVFAKTITDGCIANERID
jgi:hypothetical protein